MITVENISKRYGHQTALAPTSLAFAPEAVTVLIGQSGCGKSTLLRMLIGLVRPDSGRVFLNGRELTPGNVEALRHSVGYVIQDGGLFPHLTALGNVTLLSRYLGKPESEIEKRVAQLADLAQLSMEALSRYPAELSGGQRQRIGIMRALMLDPPLLLLDEPLGALDPITRYELQSQLREIFTRLKKTVVLVTHDMNEAAYLGNEIVLMREGSIIQQGTLDDLLKRPQESYVSDFIRAQRTVLPPLEDTPA